MRTGLFAAHEHHAPTTLLDHATAAEDAGFDSVWTRIDREHLYLNPLRHGR
ncbi:hypothetical protein [Natronomonas amylolytica]|uniref:hypothetical protein n=1 Tax=Natronomonas amylolytica TaxID=3108498 RepID=UPI003009E3A9